MLLLKLFLKNYQRLYRKYLFISTRLQKKYSTRDTISLLDEKQEILMFPVLLN
jgi:hypothetical protein